jgi:mercuric ion transport protein
MVQLVLRSDSDSADKDGARVSLVAAGGILGAIAASSCCLVPVALFSLGASGAWIGTLTSLAPYQPIFIAVTLFLLGYGYWLVRRRSRVGCVDGTACARPMPTRLVTVALWSASLLVLAAIAFPYVAPAIFN